MIPEPRRDLDTDAALRVVDRLADAGVRFIAFSGGEPFLRRDVFELMGRARARGIGIGARSNGTRITTDVAVRLRAQLSVLLRHHGRRAGVAVSPNCALLGPCVVNFKPHVTCEGFMTPCYLSTRPLLHVLQTEPEDIAAVLFRERPASIDCRGRHAWTSPPTLGMRLPVVA